MNELSGQKNPFFLYIGYNAPHWPIQAPADLIQKYADRYGAGWDELRKQRHQRQIDMGVVSKEWPLSPRDPRVPAWTDAKDKGWEMGRMAVYGATIDRLDQGIGRIIESVERAGIADNTLIVFMSDNGGNAEEIARGTQTAPNSRAGKFHGINFPGQPVPCEIGMTCTGNVPGVMPGDQSTFQSIGIPWGNCANTPFRMYKHYT
ncbi:MAG TPA: sulfatase-like hydrolase/transferase [Bryocella sp.]|nr:sulfatase-like hydrolase/transferase [Bryocella sp.]